MNVEPAASSARVVCIWFDTPVATQKVAEVCLRFSSQICTRQDRAVFVEIAKSKRLFSTESFLARLRVSLRRLGLTARIALGHDIADALVCAKNGVIDLNGLPLSVLTDFIDPFETDSVSRKYTDRMIDAFQDVGIHTVGDFKKIPLSELISRFGPIAAIAKQRVHFEVSMVWPYWRPEEVITEKTDFPHFAFYGEMEPLLFEMKKQLDHIFQRLWSRGRKAQAIRVLVHSEINSLNPHPFREFNFEFLFAQSTTKGALNIIKERLFTDFEKKPFTTPLETLETTVTAHVPGLLAQKSLLNRNEETDEQMQALLGQLIEIHGQGQIYHAEIVEDRRPERSWKKSTTPQPGPSGLNLVFPLRPTHVVRAERIHLTGDYVHIRGKPHKIISRSGLIERISGGWHDKPDDLENSFDRNYYNIELEGGLRICVFETPDGLFFLQGYYG